MRIKFLNWELPKEKVMGCNEDQIAQKVKTIPLKGQKSVTGWTDLEGTTHVFIKRTAPGLELKRDNS